MLRVCCFLVLKAATLMHQSVQERPEVRPTVEEGPLTEQQLGLRQAEDRLRRDYIYRLLKVRKPLSITFVSQILIICMYNMYVIDPE